MYIEYDTIRWRVDDIKSGAISGPYQQLPEHDSPVIPFSKTFTPPKKLVRIEDMKVIDGDQATEGYYALSYAWNWRGEPTIGDDGEEKIHDKGQHKIILHQENDKVESKSVKFKWIIQRFCQDLNIKYIWYDHWCIDKSERLQEIQETHQIYRHAYCTLILVPELNVTLSDVKLVGKMKTASVDAILRSEWIKRMWTLQETYTAERLLFVGSNAYMWSTVAATMEKSKHKLSGLTLYSICAKPLQWNASAALFHARGRKTGVPQDRTFALGNIFPEIMKNSGIKIDYERDPLELLIQFYTALAKNDLSLLCFGEPTNVIKNDDHEDRWPKDDELPSWTGVTGIHVPHVPSTGHPPRSSFAAYMVDERLLRVRSTYISIPVEKVPLHVGKEDHGLHLNGSRSWERSLETNLQEKSIRIVMGAAGYTSIGKHFGLKVSHRLPISRGQWAWFDTSASPEYTELFLSLTEEDCSECAILSNVTFEIGELYEGSRDFKAYPVVREDGDYYKSIGLCFADDLEHLSSGIETEQEFIIR